MQRQAYLVQQQLSLANNGGVLISKEEITLREELVNHTIDGLRSTTRRIGYNYVVFTMSLESQITETGSSR